ncbi:hypothetical protein [Acuticoccus kandeliae]|uniref:hypothetical protein n=1 Tax=Acuticoccus kandeliae TaxID=2073160 RepID=UPI000D3E3AA7|nr:hypothetical protein [Acuticoccus kandeliae]
MAARIIDRSHVSGLLRCAAFAAAVGVGAFLVESVLGSGTMAVLIVAVLSWLFAFGIGRPQRWFQKDLVDIVYYSVAMVGVVLLFTHQAPERAKIEALESLAPAREAVDETGARLAAFDEAVARRKQILSAIYLDRDGFLDELKRAEAFAAVQLTDLGARACAEASGFQIDLNPPERDSLRAVGDRIAAENACTAAMDTLAAEREAMMAQSLDFATIERETARFSALTERSLTLGGLSVSPAEAVADLTDRRDDAAIAADRATLSDAFGAAEKELAARETDYANAAAAADRARSTFVGALALKIWPYVLIILLALKLGRSS